MGSPSLLTQRELTFGKTRRCIYPRFLTLVSAFVPALVVLLTRRKVRYVGLGQSKG